MPGVTVFVFVLGALVFGSPLLSQPYLEYDEVSHFLVATWPTLSGLLESSREQHAHPPLIFWLLRIWIACFGEGESTLRGLPFLLGLGALGGTWAWAKGRFGSTAAVLGVLMLTACPVFLNLSTVVRGYSLLVLLTVSFLYFRDRFFAQPCPRTWLPFVLSLLLLPLSHYTALVVVASIGLVDVGVLLAGRDRWKRLGWMAAQGAFATELGWLYVTHLDRLRRGTVRIDAVDGWLSRFFFRPKEESLWDYLTRGTLEWFGWLTNHPGMGLCLFGLFLLGLALLWFVRRDRESFFLCLCPLVGYALSGIFKVLPYGGIRHGIGWVPFVLFPAAVALAWIGNRIFVRLPRPTRPYGALVPGVLGLFAVGYVARFEVPTIRLSGEKAKPARMHAAVARLRKILAAGEWVATDSCTGGVWNYYLRGQMKWSRFVVGDFRVLLFGGGSILIDKEWRENARTISEALPRIARLLPGEDSLWFVIAGDFLGPDKDDLTVRRRLPPDWILDSWSEGYVWALKLDLRRARAEGNSVATLGPLPRPAVWESRRSSAIARK